MKQQAKQQIKVYQKKLKCGTILLADDKVGLYIKVKNGVIKVLEIQGENAKRMSVCDFLRGNKLNVRRKI